MASERNKQRSGKSFAIRGPVLASCKTPFTCTQKELSCLYFQKTKSEERIVNDLFGYTSPTAMRQMCPRYVPSISNKVAIDSF